MSLTALMTAAEYGDADGVRKHIEQARQQYSGYTALMFAATGGHEECTRILAEYESGLRRDDGWTALMLAAYFGRVGCVQLLVTKELRLQDNEGETALIKASREGHIDCVRLLLPEAGLQTKAGWTALMHATRNDNMDCVRLLAESEAKIRTVDGQTALTMALTRTRFKVAALLCTFEGSIAGLTNLMCAALKQDVGGLVAFIGQAKQYCAGHTALMMAAACGYDQLVSGLIDTEAGLVVSHGDNEGYTALMLAAREGHINCVRLLLHAEGGRKAKGGTSALMLAARYGHREAVELLIPQEATIVDDFGKTALFGAAHWGHANCIPILMEREAGLSSANGATALMEAVACGHTDCAHYLLCEAGRQTLDIDDWTGELPAGLTALMIAAHTGNTALVRLLKPFEFGLVDTQNHTAHWYARHALEKPSDLIDSELDRMRAEVARELDREEDALATYRSPPPPKDITPLMHAALIGRLDLLHESLQYAKHQTELGMTALMFAAITGHVECVEALVSQEAQLQDNQGWTALMYASQYGHIGCVKLLLSEATLENNVLQTALDVARVSGRNTLEVSHCGRCADIIQEHLANPLVFSHVEGRIPENNPSTGFEAIVQQAHALCTGILLQMQYYSKDSVFGKNLAHIKFMMDGVATSLDGLLQLEHETEVQRLQLRLDALEDQVAALQAKVVMHETTLNSHLNVQGIPQHQDSLPKEITPPIPFIMDGAQTPLVDRTTPPVEAKDMSLEQLREIIRKADPATIQTLLEQEHSSHSVLPPSSLPPYKSSPLAIAALTEGPPDDPNGYTYRQETRASLSHPDTISDSPLGRVLEIENVEISLDVEKVPENTPPDQKVTTSFIFPVLSQPTISQQFRFGYVPPVSNTGSPIAPAESITEPLVARSSSVPTQGRVPSANISAEQHAKSTIQGI
ncbi:Ankyrin repeat protein 1 [Giardia muris]|uniref:Ankyrin repeat protein 1 n=1 Tax=Giardia muris TaxID=5742 RepID=A0A4Z1SXK1_GIAMU|nr:Ankyrin repeat protein 1 [Giardia muris]|eukprot:TNJ30502.1 Ankyrin repeat protein 1 [Giardia muris]